MGVVHTQPISPHPDPVRLPAQQMELVDSMHWELRSCALGATRQSHFSSPCTWNRRTGLEAHLSIHLANICSDG